MIARASAAWAAVLLPRSSPASRQGLAAPLPQRPRRVVQRRGGVGLGEVGAALVEVQQGDGVVERAAVGAQRLAAALADREARVVARRDVGLGDHDGVDHAGRRDLGGAQRGAAAVRDRGGDDRHLVPAEGGAARRRLPGVHRPEREADREHDMLAPGGLRVAARMGVLEGEAVRRLGDEGRALGRRERDGEGRTRAGLGGRGALSAHQPDRVGREGMGAGAGALVGQRHGAAALQAPFGDADAAIDAARAGGGHGDDAGAGGVEGVGDLHGEGKGGVAGGITGERHDLGAEDAALGVRCRGADERAVEPAEAAARGDIDDGAVVAVQRGGAELLDRGRGGERGERLRQPVHSEAAGQQVGAGGRVVAGDDGVGGQEVGARWRVGGETRQGEQRCDADADRDP